MSEMMTPKSGNPEIQKQHEAGFAAMPEIRGKKSAHLSCTSDR